MKKDHSPKVLLVDDEKNLVIMLAKILRRHNYDVTVAHDGEEGLKVLRENMPDPDHPEDKDSPQPFEAVLTDLRMPKLDGMAFLKEMRETWKELPVIVLTGHGSIQSAVEAMKAGAVDYLIKPANPDELLMVFERALEMQNLRSENRRLKQQLGQNYEPSYEIIGESGTMQKTMEMVRAVARNRSTILVTGESGTGKELIARAVHDSGPFARYPFIAVNCGALSETLLESQLFGHKKGAFTGAVNDHMGFFQAAEGGTLFLDEISEMSPHLQVKLLRALQEREIIPVGDNAPQKVNVRLICASNRDLEHEVREGNFREDLYYRLNIVNIQLLPLRLRIDDIPPLVGHFILRFAKEYDVAPKSVQPDAMERLTRYPWPGNIRELENVIERTFALSLSDTISEDDLPPQLFRSRDEALNAMKPVRKLPPAQVLAHDGKKEKVSGSGSGDPGPSGNSNGSIADRTHAPASAAAAADTSSPAPKFTEPFVPKAPETPMTLEEVEKRQIVEALRRAKGKKVEAARILGIDRKRLYRKMKKYELN